MGCALVATRATALLRSTVNSEGQRWCYRPVTPCALKRGGVHRASIRSRCPHYQLAAIACGLVLAACGASGKPSTAANADVALRFAQCMRAHGVPNFPDPNAGGGGFQLGSGINPQSPAFASAHQACARLLPGSRRGPQASESQFLSALKFAQCMRVHGFSDFPDPTRSDSGRPPILVIGPGMFYRVSPSFDPNTPAVKRAVAACGRAS